jgi:hypothetical protein
LFEETAAETNRYIKNLHNINQQLAKLPTLSHMQFGKKEAEVPVQNVENKMAQKREISSTHFFYLIIAFLQSTQDT